VLLGVVETALAQLIVFFNVVPCPPARIAALSRCAGGLRCAQPECGGAITHLQKGTPHIMSCTEESVKYCNTSREQQQRHVVHRYTAHYHHHRHHVNYMYAKDGMAHDNTQSAVKAHASPHLQFCTASSVPGAPSSRGQVKRECRNESNMTATDFTTEPASRQRRPPLPAHHRIIRFIPHQAPAWESGCSPLNPILPLLGRKTPRASSGCRVVGWRPGDEVVCVMRLFTSKDTRRCACGDYHTTIERLLESSHCKPHT
jgi:hypothetical protein